MKNKLLKTLEKLIVSFFFVLGTTYNTSCRADWELIKVPETGNILKITDVKAGKLFSEFKSAFKNNFQHIVITGECNDSDISTVSSMAWDCETIDLSGVKALNLPERQFCSKKNLKVFKCPENLETIREFSFWSCPKLRTMVLSKTLKVIKEGCFQFCSKLSLKIPSNVGVAETAFQDCLNVVII